MRRSAVLIFLWCSFNFMNFIFSFIPVPLPVNNTAGGVWPKPVKYLSSNSFYVLQPASFNFKVERYDCDIIQEAIRRYYHLVFINVNSNQQSSNDKVAENSRNDAFLGYLDLLHIHLMAPCEIFPSESMDERYELLINADGYENTGLLIAQSVWGVLRGLETFSQIVVPIGGYKYAIRSTSISDFPRFPFRGLLIDTSRHYLPLKTITRILDAMAYSKLNVLHWHIVDDQSFPYQSTTFPNLSSKGSYNEYLAIYSQADVRRIIEHARLRGIRVIPEFDSPGHTLSWGKGIPNLLTKCGISYPAAEYGPIDPTRDYNYVILEKLFKEINDVFPDKYLHLGGDEVEFGCWESNENITDFMRIKGISSYAQLEAYYIYKLLNITNRLDAKAIVWQEVFDNGVPLRNDTIVQVWKGDYYLELERITHYGYRTLLSSCWYLDSLESGGDWVRFYQCNPLAFSGTLAQKRLVQGGEACMWGEVVDETNIQQRIWPRACATAEILWYGGQASDAVERLEEHVCRLKKRGIPAQPPNGPAFCPYTVM